MSFQGRLILCHEGSSGGSQCWVQNLLLQRVMRRQELSRHNAVSTVEAIVCVQKEPHAVAGRCRHLQCALPAKASASIWTRVSAGGWEASSQWPVARRAPPGEAMCSLCLLWRGTSRGTFSQPVVPVAPLILKQSGLIPETEQLFFILLLRKKRADTKTFHKLTLSFKFVFF